MEVKRLTLTAADIPEVLRRIDTPPQQLYTAGADIRTLLEKPCVTVVGTRKVSSYGRTVTTQLVSELAKAGVVIISGLAIGVDSIAHKAALDAGGLTIAVLPSGLNRVYPASHQSLARQIVRQGGALVTEYSPDAPMYKINFIARNRIASGMADVLLITEAAEKSGTLHTARFALEQGKEVMVVPGNITSPTSAGTNNLLKSGAAPVTAVSDIFHVLGIEPTTHKAAVKSHDPHEQILLDLLSTGISNGEELLQGSKLTVPLFNQTLTMLEIRGHIRPLGNNHWALH